MLYQALASQRDVLQHQCLSCSPEELTALQAVNANLRQQLRALQGVKVVMVAPHQEKQTLTVCTACAGRAAGRTGRTGGGTGGGHRHLECTTSTPEACAGGTGSCGGGGGRCTGRSASQRGVLRQDVLLKIHTSPFSLPCRPWWTMPMHWWRRSRHSFLRSRRAPRQHSVPWQTRNARPTWWPTCTRASCRRFGVVINPSVVMAR